MSDHYEALGREAARRAIEHLLGRTISDLRDARETADSHSKGIGELRNQVRILEDDRRKLDAQLVAQKEKMAAVGKERAELESRVEALSVPLCIGQKILGILRDKGAWRAQDGRGVIAASDLFEGGGPSVYDALLSHTNSVRAQCTLPSAIFTTYITAEAYRKLNEEVDKQPYFTCGMTCDPSGDVYFAGARLRVVAGGGIHFCTVPTQCMTA